MEYSMANNLTDNVNLFQPTGFRIIIDRKNFSNLEFFAQRVNHPGVINSAVEVQFPRVEGIPMPGNTLQFGELTMDVLLDEDFNAYEEIYNWIVRQVNEKHIKRRSQMQTTTENPPTYADISIIALTSHNNKNKILKYIDAIPTAVGDIVFDTTNAGVEFVTFPATFRYSYFEIE
jgi:hypothetical protein